MLATPHDPSFQQNWLDHTGQQTAIHPVISSGAKEMLNKSEDERSGIMSSALTYFKTVP